MRPGSRKNFGPDRFSSALGGPPSPLILMPGYESSVERLIETAITLNSLTPAREFALNGYDATLTEWPTRVHPSPGLTFAVFGTTAQTVGLPSPLTGSREAAVMFSGSGAAGDVSKGYAAPNTTTGNVGLFDGCGEALLVDLRATPTSSTTSQVINKTGTAVARGHDLRFFGTSGHTARVYLKHEGGSIYMDSASLTAALSNVLFLSWFWNRDEASSNGSGIAINGAWSGTGVDFSAMAAIDLTGDQPLTVGSRWPDGAYGLQTAQVLYVSEVFGAGLIAAGAGGKAEVLALHQQRFAAIMASKPYRSRYSIPKPTSSGTTIAAYQTKRLDDGTSRLFLMGANSPRFEKGVDLAGTPYVGAVIEGAVTNAAWNYKVFNSGWGCLRASIVTTAVTLLDGTTGTANILKEDGAAGQTHYMGSQNYTAALNERLVGYIDIQAYNRNWVYLKLQRTGSTRVDASFDLATATAYLNSGDTATCGIIALGGSRYRCWISGFADSATTYNMQLYVAEGMHDIVLDGLNQNSYYLLDGQLAGGSSYPLELVPNAEAAATKPADYQPYPITEGHEIGVGKGALAIKYYAPIFTPTAALYLGAFHDGTANNHIVPYIDTDGCFKALTRKTAGNNGDAAGAANRCDGYIHEGMICWAAGRLWVVDEGVRSAEDNVVDIPTGLTTFSLGSNSTPANHAGPIRIIRVQSHREPKSWGERWSK